VILPIIMFTYERRLNCVSYAKTQCILRNGIDIIPVGHIDILLLLPVDISIIDNAGSQ
jgi:hypothetical protein